MPSPNPGLPTLADVAREAGVSGSAASAVLNNAKTSARISAATRQRILEAAERLGYQQSTQARRQAELSGTIGVAMVIPGSMTNYLDDSYAAAVLAGIVVGGTQYGYSSHVFPLPSWSIAADRLAGYCGHRIDGMILVAPTLGPSVIKSLPDHLPMVAIHGNSPLAGVVNLVCNDEEGGFLATNHLIGLGHRRILHIAGPEGASGSDARIAGWRRAMAGAGYAHDDDLLLRGGFSQYQADQALNRWMSRNRGPMPSAVFCANDAMAFGCVEALVRRGLRVPADVSVVGFDDLPGAAAMQPRLTTLAQPLRWMGRRAVEILIAALDLPKRDPAIPPPEIMPVNLVVRESTAPAPAQPVPIPPSSPA